ncbi:MAG TPA: rhodanese-like domain-containing protein [Candidatus Acidoferrum sp.]|nr:rhodanese-like domain-containing protein [Candidatus Acidoferrum sp.]
MASQVKVASSPAEHEISRDEIRRRLGDSSLTIVDVLQAESYAVAHIPGAIGLPLEQVTARAREVLPDLTADIAVYCGKFT